MAQGIALKLTGAAVPETAKALGRRLIELGCAAEQLDPDAAARLGGAESAAYVCRLLTRNGVIVVVSAPGVTPEGETAEIEISDDDTPDFAAEKVIEALADEGIIALPETDYSAEEEEQIQRRLADLGYIE